MLQCTCCCWAQPIISGVRPVVLQRSTGAVAEPVLPFGRLSEESTAQWWNAYLFLSPISFCNGVIQMGLRPVLSIVSGEPLWCTPVVPLSQSLRRSRGYRTPWTAWRTCANTTCRTTGAGPLTATCAPGSGTASRPRRAPRPTPDVSTAPGEALALAQILLQTRRRKRGSCVTSCAGLVALQRWQRQLGDKQSGPDEYRGLTMSTSKHCSEECCVDSSSRTVLID